MICQAQLSGGSEPSSSGSSQWSRYLSRSTFVGTAPYMAPEVMSQLDGYNQAADIWSFGAGPASPAVGLRVMMCHSEFVSSHPCCCPSPEKCQYTYDITPCFLLAALQCALMLIVRRNAQALSCWSLRAGAAPHRLMVCLFACKQNGLCKRLNLMHLHNLNISAQPIVKVQAWRSFDHS